jgi:hypothetical protein
LAEEQKVFSEAEVSALIKRAVELQEQSHVEYQPGVTSEELEHMASELGIAAEFLKQAIAEGGLPTSRKGPLNLTEEFEKVVDVEIPPEDFDLFVEEMRNRRRRSGGGIVQIGRTLKGQAWTGWSLPSVEITSRNGRTRIRVKSNPLFAWLVGIHPAFVASLIVFSALGAHGLILPAVGIVAGLATASLIAFRWLLRKGHEASQAFTERLARKAREQAPQVPVSGVSVDESAAAETQTLGQQ